MRETYCGKCQGMVNGNGCDAKDCEVNDGKGYKEKAKREKKADAAVETSQVNG